MENELQNLAIECISNNNHSWVDIFQALLTPIIGIIAICVAYQQYKTNKNRLKFEMYERKLKVFNKFVSFFKEILNGKEINPSRFYASTAETEFLFGRKCKDLVDYREKIYNEGYSIFTLQLNLKMLEKRRNENDKIIEIENQIGEKKEWFIKQLTQEKVNEKFRKYLTL